MRRLTSPNLRSQSRLNPGLIESRHTRHMTTVDYVRYQLDDLGFQLNACFGAIGEDLLELKLTPQSMTPRETVEHLCEAYLAFLAHVEGEKWNWGSFSIADRSKPNLMETLHEIRGRATTAACADEKDEDRLKTAHAYITAHDAYHVGQLSLLLVNHNPAWDPYSIYPS